MPTQPPQTQKWPSDRAVLFIHGVGNARPGDYDPLVATFKTALGDDAKNLAYYFLYYDAINEWFSQKQQAAPLFTKLVGSIASRLGAGTDPTTLGNVAAGFGGDVIWPVLLADARLAVRAAVLQQLQQIVLDGIASGQQPRYQRITVIAHSMGCFHIYEALAHASSTPSEGLGPASAGIVLENLIFMASPVQLIRTVGQDMGGLVPQQESIHGISDTALTTPSEPGEDGSPTPCARRTVSIAGNLDPVGGYFFRKQLPWAYMNLPNQVSFVDQEQVASVDGQDESLTLANILKSARQDDGPPKIAPNNPHDWAAYINRHAADLRGWLA